MAQKFYAVKNGIQPGVYTTWDECKKNVHGFSGAIYKSFTTKEEAERFIENPNEILDDHLPDSLYGVKSKAIAYVDGSYEERKKQYSYGAVIFYNGNEEHFCEKFSDQDMISMRNVAGEIEGAKRAIKFCIDNNIKALDIYYDYEGIEKWCTGIWKAKKSGTIAYKEYYDKAIDKVSINFIKVKGHSGNKYNDLADLLAKSALGIGDQVNCISNKVNGIVANNVKHSDFVGIIDLLKEDFGDLKCFEKDIPYGKEYTLTIFNNEKKQRLIVSSYIDKNKVYINGEKEELFNRLTSYIVELLEIEDIPNFLNTVHDLQIDKDVVESEFNSYFPNSYNLIPDELNNYLHQAVYNLHITGNIYVADFLVEPAIRPLEGILKIALQENNIPIRKKQDNYDSFFVFKKNKDRYILRDKYVREDHSENILNYLSECYTYFNKNRHTLLHWDNPKNELDTTRILTTVQEAHTIIKDTIKLIDKYYKLR
ncbi:ribonuclease H1 domain-containing protein [Clostridium botulinum]|uniref:ribonuclease H1 domain-containing protein n=1 Tax=Clostridium botulinum TaxID=1491 RepID=UPI0009B274DE